MPLLRCPNCDKVLIKYVSGCNAEYVLECRGCKEDIRIYSAGKTLICDEHLSMPELDKMMRFNKCPNFD